MSIPVHDAQSMEYRVLGSSCVQVMGDFGMVWYCGRGGGVWEGDAERGVLVIGLVSLSCR